MIQALIEPHKFQIANIELPTQRKLTVQKTQKFPAVEYFPCSVPASYDCGHSTMIGRDLCTSYRMRSSSNKAKTLKCFGQHANA